MNFDAQGLSGKRRVNAMSVLRSEQSANLKPTRFLRNVH
jgi:hypothetical protein